MVVVLSALGHGGTPRARFSACSARLPHRRCLVGRHPSTRVSARSFHDRVTSGEWRPGDQIPTIRELGELYGVSRITVVQALDELSHEGLLVRWQGKGVFVGQPRPDVPRMPLQSFTEETLGRGHTPSSRTLRFVRERRTEGSSRLGA